MYMLHYRNFNGNANIMGVDKVVLDPQCIEFLATEIKLRELKLRTTGNIFLYRIDSNKAI